MGLTPCAGADLTEEAVDIITDDTRHPAPGKLALPPVAGCILGKFAAHCCAATGTRALLPPGGCSPDGGANGSEFSEPTLEKYIPAAACPLDPPAIGKCPLPPYKACIPPGGMRGDNDTEGDARPGTRGDNADGKLAVAGCALGPPATYDAEVEH